ncbi:hydrolase, NUDIX family [Fusobacterium sp. oral taxon 370 str. F0437]|uniref:NUDIX hydrolase n=1 Tax=Fusobacterium sp. oral taxon 370 TaxID=712288 RepID=UPI000234A52F|nr:CoA pyrophosphatase [Fusobacterium sp. oral taxon 370]EHI76237.1 hydrolase, NUDIX family [Fusobacterium sp. oral taxon 370 str. F0437]
MNKNRILLRERYFESAVMLCIANIGGKDCFILEKRAKNIRQAGEISFPGGKKDKADKSFKETAIRETMEELQIKRNKISNVSKLGLLVTPLGVLIECYICKLNIENLDEINYNRDEVEKLLAVPIEFFMKTEAVKGEVEICNKAKFDIKKYNFPERYENDWRIPNRYVYIYMFEEEPIWGMTAEIICDFIKTLKNEGKVGFYEYK